MNDKKSAAVTIDPMELRKALGAFVTGVTVITTCEGDGTPRGFTANSFTSVSLDPPLVLVCIAKTAFSLQVFCDCENFAVNILAEDQTDTSAVFASKDPDKFANANWRKGVGGSPVIENTAAWLECARHDVVEAGDHVILIGRVIDFAHSVSNPLGFCRGSYVMFGLERQALAAPGQQTSVGAILESEGRILMLRQGDQGALSCRPAQASATAVMATACWVSFMRSACRPTSLSCLPFSRATTGASIRSITVAKSSTARWKMPAFGCSRSTRSRGTSWLTHLCAPCSSAMSRSEARIDSESMSATMNAARFMRFRKAISRPFHQEK